MPFVNQCPMKNPGEICAGMSTLWVKEGMLKGGRPILQWSDQSTTQIGVHKELSSSSEARLGEAGLEMHPSRPVLYGSHGWAEIAAMIATVPDGFSYLTMKVPVPHAMAIHKEGDRVTFFDPNSGIHTCTVGEFASSFAPLMQKTYSSSAADEFKVYPIARISNHGKLPPPR